MPEWIVEGSYNLRLAFGSILLLLVTYYIIINIPWKK